MKGHWRRSIFTSSLILCHLATVTQAAYLLGVCNFDNTYDMCSMEGPHDFKVRQGHPDDAYDWNAMDSGHSGFGYLYLTRSNRLSSMETPELMATIDSPSVEFAYFLNGRGEEDSYIKLGVIKSASKTYQELWHNKKHDKRWYMENVTLPVIAGDRFRVVWKAYAQSKAWENRHTYLGLDDIGILESDPVGQGEPCYRPPPMPYARPWECTEPKRIINNKFPDGTVCQTDCLPGYSIEGDPEVVCRDGKWYEAHGLVVFFCFDTEAPVFLACPKDFKLTTNYGWKTVRITIGTPPIDDNSGMWSSTLYINGQEQIGTSPTLDLPVGIFNVSFLAEDYNGNQDICSYMLTVEPSDKTPPSVVSCPKSQVIESAVPISVEFEMPTFVDDTGYIDKIEATHHSGDLLSWGRHEITITAYDNSSNSASCQFVISVIGVSCESLHSPKNGALVCHESYAGGFCVSMCGEGRDFGGTQGLQIPSDYLCNTEGTWYPFDFTFDCTAPRNEPTLLPSSYYYDTTCNDTQTQKAMQQHALDIYNESEVDITTGVNLKPDDFYVICGPLEDVYLLK
ncbi:uncharacterized protein LOC143018071 [Oratosquilla oratoria]|uniref:uncharacterized protein LOC143018071 n=1 Tax=Oratosquilla oratoria TaxID=337810 RepID=UPI003F77721A